MEYFHNSMKTKLFLIVVILIATPFLIKAQHKQDTAAKYIIVPNAALNEKDMYFLNTVPELTLPDEYRSGPKSVLPSAVDNSLQLYTRPATNQEGYECGQSANIVHNFTYEIDRARNLIANVAANQYVAHFAWDFFNNAIQYGGGGVSFFDTWEVMKYCGTPSVQTYGGLWLGGYLRWMSGYSSYYAAMMNRIEGGYCIKAGTPEGLITFKHWLYDHLEGSPVGGVANYYSGYYNPDATLPAGTPEAGKAVVTSAGGHSHTWTAYGYNDSIRYDYNGDGRYTNNIDINSDGIVDMRDWEIGGLKIRNGYAGTGWGNNSFSYLMYKTLAERNSTSGIWNNSVYVLKVRPTYNPLLTMKVTLNHTCRNQIKVIAGISTNLSATRPSKMLDFPIFNYQGGQHYLQGDSTEANKTLEFGLDISPLLTEINSGQAARYFLQVVEKDPGSIAGGMINNYSVIDYTNGTSETVCTSSNVPLNNNDTTTLSITATVNFNKVNITTNALNPASLYTNFSQQLDANNGTPPYLWQLVYDYTETATNATFPNVSTEQLHQQNTDAMLAVKKIAFRFPFCGKTYDTVYISQDGFIRFDNGSYNWPFLINRRSLFTASRIIAPFQAAMDLNGIWYEGDGNSATFRWRTSASGQSGSDINFAVRLYPSGKIEFYYGTVSYSGDIDWFAGLSDNYRNTYFARISNSFNSNTTGRKIELLPAPSPKNVNLSAEGLLTYAPEEECNSCSLKVMVSDNNLIKASKTFPVATKGIVIRHSYTAGSDTIIQAGDTVRLTVYLKNIGSSTVNNARMFLRTFSPHIQFIDSTENLTPLVPQVNDTFRNAFSFKVDSTVFDGTEIILNTVIYSPTDTFNGHLTITAHTFVLELGRITVADGGDQILRAGETSALIVEMKNTGGATAYNLHATLFTWDPYINVVSGNSNIGSLAGEEAKNLFYIISVNNNAPARHLVLFIMDVTASNGYAERKYFCVNIGENMETFETGNFTSYPWSFADSAWFVTDSISYAGTHCARSARHLTDNQKSSLIISLHVINDSYISFYRKVSCESHAVLHDYDWFAFYIDGTEMERWDGDMGWNYQEYPVDAGQRIFKWMYNKDYSVSWGGDGAWLDNILFPPYGDLIVDIDENSSGINAELRQNYPNPFRNFTSISFSLAKSSGVTLRIFDMTGNLIRSLINNESMDAGDNTLLWDGTDNNGRRVSNGVYYYSLQTDSYTTSRKMIMIN